MRRKKGTGTFILDKPTWLLFFIMTVCDDMPLCSQEFEVLAQIRLLQSSCKNCVFTADEAFIQWYQSVPTLTEEERYLSESLVLIKLMS